MTPNPERHRATQRLAERADALRADIQRELVDTAGTETVALRQVGELAVRVTQALATCLHTMSIEEDTELWRTLQPKPKGTE